MIITAVPQHQTPSDCCAGASQFHGHAQVMLSKVLNTDHLLYTCDTCVTSSAPVMLLASYHVSTT